MKLRKKLFSSLLIPTLVFCFTGCNSSYVPDSDLNEKLLEGKLIYSQLSLEETTAKAEVKERLTNEKIYFDDIADAWSNVMSRPDEKLIMTIYEDWVATDGSFKTKDNQLGFGKTGGLELLKRSDSLTLCLNNYKIDRALTSPIEAGSVISVNNNANYFEVCYGTITGGYTKGRGGGCFVNTKDCLCLNDVDVINNHAIGNGGGIYIGTKTGSVSLKNTSIINNISDNYGGGIYLDATTKNLFKNVYCDLSFSWLCYVKDNTGKDGRNNLIVRNSNLKGNSYVKDFNAVYPESQIYINTSKNATGEYVTCTFNEENYGDDVEVSYLYCDNPNYTFKDHKKIVYKNDITIAANFHFEVTKK